MRCAVLAITVTAVAIAQDVLPPGILLLSRIRRHVAGELARLPNISCLETIQREFQPANGKFRHLDTVRLEVLTNGHRELYAAPGERKFSEQHPIQYVGSGVIGDGFFGLFLREVLVDGSVSYDYKGEEDVGGRKLVRYDWRLPLMQSGHVFTLQEGHGKVGMRGSFWADPQTYDVVQLQMAADEIPLTLPISEAVTTIRYAQISLGDTESALLPESGDFRMVRFSGEIDHNQIEFTHCRLYGAQSTINFGAADAPPSTEVVRFGISSNDDTLRPLPAGLQVALKLTSRVTGDLTVGSPIDGTVVRVIAPKGVATPIVANARVRGRIRRMEHYTSPMTYYVVAIEFTEVESEGIRYRFYADLTELDSAQGASQALSKGRTETKAIGPGFAGSHSQSETLHVDNLWLSKLPGVASFFVPVGTLDLSPGFRTTWKTQALKP
jgi:hypothetical protein